MSKLKDHTHKDHKHKEHKKHKDSKHHKKAEKAVKTADEPPARGMEITKPLPPRSRNGPEQVNANDEQQSESDSESDQVEDENGDLVTAAIDQGIDKVLQALRANDAQSLKDPKLSFFPEIGAEGTGEAREPVQQEKPVFLKDYQRETLLSGAGVEDDDDEQHREQPATYAGQQETDRAALLSEINAQDNDDDDDLLQKRSIEREIPEVELPDPEKDADGFLNAYLSNKAWMRPASGDKKPSYRDVVGEKEESDDDEEFDDLTEKFENAYNFRFEDPASAEIVSYARDQSTLRRDKKGSRQKKRERERESREKEKEQQKLEMAKLKKTKVSEISDKLSQLQEALGEGDELLAQRLSAEDLDGDWDNDEWDRRMQKLFDEEFYDREGSEIAPVLEQRGNEEEDLGEEYAEPEQNDDLREDAEDSIAAAAAVAVAKPRKLSRKELKRKAEQFIDENQDLLVEETTKPNQGFRYREVEPESFGLSARDILLASDKELNQFVGLKKLASYREKDRVDKDRKRYAKRKRLREWRKSVFGVEDEPTDELWEQRKRAIAEEDGASEAPKHKSKKRRKHQS